MVYCSAVGCNNGSGSGKSFFQFPSEPGRRAQWISKVNRAGSRPGKMWEPTKHAKLCSDHFEAECFERYLAISIGFMENTRKSLKPDAVPSIFAAPAHSTSKSKKIRKRSALSKCHRIETVSELMEESKNLSLEQSHHEELGLPDLPKCDASTTTSADTTEPAILTHSSISIETQSSVTKAVSSQTLWYPCKEEASIMNCTEKDAKIAEEFGIKKEDIDLDIKEESVEYSGKAESNYKCFKLLLLPLKQKSRDRSSPHSQSKTSFCKDAKKNGEDIESNAGCDPTCSNQPTPLLRPIEQVFLEELPDTCKNTWTGISQEESSRLDEDDYQKDFKPEEDDYLSVNFVEINEEIPNYDAHSYETCGIQSPHLSPFPEGEGNPLEYDLTKSEERRFTCDVCCKAFTKRSTYVAHMRVHSGEKPFTCDVCNKAYIHKSKLVVHMRVHTAEKPFTCDVCCKGFTERYKYVEHMRVHTKERPYTCNVCNKAFSHKVSLVAHMPVHTGEKPFTCDVCNKAFHRRDSIVSHMRVHTGVKPFTCHVCNKTFTYRHTLVAHRRVHTKEKPYTCVECKKDFTQKSALVKHLQVHTGSPFTCDVCDKTFTHTCTFTKHMKIHTVEKPFVCVVCDKAYVHKSRFAKHIETHWKECPFSLDICNKVKTFGI